MERIAIVGGGIVGTSVAYHLRNSSIEVTLFERGELGAATTAASMALFHRQDLAPTAYDARLRDLAWETYGPLIEEGTLSFTRIGSLYVAESEATYERLDDVAETLSDLGAPSRVLDADEFGAFEIEPDAGLGALYTPDEGYFDASEVVERFAAGAREGGARIETNIAVTDLRVGDDVRIETADAVHEVDAVVNAAGPWAPEIDEFVGTSHPLRHTRGPIVSFEAGPDRPEPFTLFEGGTYLRSAGETRVHVGHLARGYDGASRLDPDAIEGVDASFREEVRDLAGVVLALEDARTVEEWVGLRTVTPDGRPLVGRASDGYVHASGMCGLGVTLAPAVGRLLADLFESGTPDDLLDPLSPTRFGGESSEPF